MIKTAIAAQAVSLGAYRCGFAAAEPVAPDAADLYDRWVAEGRHGSMEYCARYADVRRDPRLLLEGARTVIVCAFPYSRTPHPLIASYALGDDYHWIVRQRLAALGQYIVDNYGGATRALVDTAPMRERYWAVRAGVGLVGINNQLIVPGAGSYFFLGELLWTGEVEPDEPCRLDCGGCMACVRACPGGALDGRGGCDARQCISYLTIEHRGPLPDDARLAGRAYGCDICQQACPHNQGPAPEHLPEFAPRPALTALTASGIMSMTRGDYKRLTANSAMSRAPLPQLLRNLTHKK